jgi:hypothetical protein
MLKFEFTLDDMPTDSREHYKPVTLTLPRAGWDVEDMYEAWLGFMVALTYNQQSIEDYLTERYSIDLQPREEG